VIATASPGWQWWFRTLEATRAYRESLSPEDAVAQMRSITELTTLLFGQW
jgi:hypothetical protein